VHVQEAIDLTFARALRAMLRQAPNVILIGEIRDLETAEIAVNASLTGHLCFSTLHTNDAPSAITRLIDIGVKPFLVASSIRGLMAQRLVRKVCKNCAEPYQPGDRELRVLHLTDNDTADATFLKGRGCAECSMTGYRGRLGIFEIFVIDDEVRKMIYEKVSSVQIREYARAHGMRTLREDGLRKAFSGTTTLEEVARVTIADEA
jgi:general secretion pathway protein E/type IV pilus assembly protein PilB